MVFLKNSFRSLLMYQPLWRAILIISVLAIAYLATTSEPYPIPSAPSDKVNHLLAFIHLTVVTRLAWPRLSRVWVATGVMAFGLVIEVTQAQLSYRDFSLMDLATDGAGIAIGLLPCAFIFGRNNGQKQSHL